MQSASNNDLIKIKAYYVRTLFPKAPVVLGTGDNTYGVVKLEILECLEGKPTENSDGTITITGEFVEPLQHNSVYVVLAKKHVHPTYGTQYNLLYINEQIDLHKLNNQKAFLASFMTPNQIEEFYKIYDNPLEIIEHHDIKKMIQVHGVGEYIANCIINRFEDNKDMSPVYSELSNYGLTPKFIQKLIRTYRSPNAVIQTVKENPYQLCNDMEGVGFKTADNIALKGGINPKSPERIKAFIRYFLQEEANERGNSYITAGELLSNVHNYFGGKEEIIEEYYDDDGNIIGSNLSKAMLELQDCGYIVVEDGANKSRRRVYLKYYYDLENNIAHHLKRLLKADNHFNYVNWKENVAHLEEKQGFAFAQEQIDGIKLGLDKQVCLICGLAGSGKSSLVSGILASLKQYTFAQCALSGKAAARLQEVTGESGSTIHRLLGYSGEGFTYDENNPLPYDIIILDEVSLVGGEIFLNLIKAIPDGAKLILLGDLGQLESIGALNLASDIYYSEEIPTVELTEIHRQAAQSGIITSAHEVRNQRQLFDSISYDGVDTLGELQDMVFDVSPNKENIRQKTIGWFKKYYESELVHGDIMSIQLISPVKERGEACVYNLNIDAQNYVNPIEAGESIMVVGSKEKPYYIHKGDKVMCIKNNYTTVTPELTPCPIYNGWVGTVVHIRTQDSEKDSFVIVNFPLAGSNVVIPYADAKKELVLGYASTIHKLQGSDAPIVIGALDYSTPPNMLTCQLLYTLLTRAKKRCVVVGQTGAINKAIASDYVSTKRTFLQELLAEQPNLDEFDCEY